MLLLAYSHANNSCERYSAPGFLFFLQFAVGLCHFRVGLSVQSSADESSSIHQFGEVHTLRRGHKVKLLHLRPHERAHIVHSNHLMKK